METVFAGTVLRGGLIRLAANPRFIMQVTSLTGALSLSKHCQDDPKSCNEASLASNIETGSNTKEEKKTGGPGGSSKIH